MKTIIIVDGIDLSGKDYFIEKISKKLKDCITIKNNFKPKDSTERSKIKDKYFDIINSVMFFNSFEYILLNRFYPSELAYSKVKRNYNAMSDPWFKLFEINLKNLKTTKVIWIYIYESYKIIKQRMYIRKEEYIIDKDIIPILKRYNKIFRNCKLKKLKIKSSEINKALKFIKNG